MLIAIATLIVGIWLIIASQEPVSTTLTLIMGIVVCVCSVVEMLRAGGYISR